jgi:protein TonB
MRFLSIVACSLMLVTSRAFPQDGAKRVTQHEAMSAVISKIAPEYPPAARQLKIQGVVEIEAVIGENGSVEHVKAMSGSPVLTKAASDALMKWKFKPFTEDGKPVKAVVTMSFTFSL